jgi:hypothetical protein
MNIISNPYNKNQQLRPSTLTYSLPFPAYSNWGYISTSDLSVDIPCIYSIEQQFPLDDDIHVILI